KGEIGSAASAIEPYEQALALAGGDAPLRASIESNLAWMMGFVGDQARAAHHARAAVEAAEASARPDLLAESLSGSVFVDLVAGRQPSREAINRALELEASGDRIRIDRCATLVHGFHLLWSGQLDAARSAFERLRTMTEEMGDESNAPVPLWHLALVELLAGNWSLASRHIDDAVQIAELT